MGHRASGGHSLHTLRNRLERDPNAPEHHKEHRMAEYKPYPKWLHFEGEPSVLVQDKAEHEAFIAGREAAEAARLAATPKRGPGRPKKTAEKVFELDSLPPPD